MNDILSKTMAIMILNRFVEQKKEVAILLLFLLLILFGCCPLAAQQPTWESLMGTLVNDEEEGTEGWESAYDVLSDMEEHPLNLNTATREDFERIPFLTDQQIEELCSYLYQYDGMRSFGELAMLNSLDPIRRQLLPYFTYIDERQREKAFPKWKDIVKYGKHNLLVTAKVPFYKRRGDDDGYLGSPYRHSLRYSFNYGDYIQAGLTGANDAGEPFFKGRNKMGYDHYSFYFILRKLGRLKALAVGHYKLRFGMGLVMNNSFSFGKLATLSTLGRSGNDIRPYASRTAANYLQGAAATVTLMKGLDLTAFISYRKRDATLNVGNTSIATLLTDGYHRTEKEMAKKNNVSETVGGGNLRFFKSGFHAGMTAVFNSFDLPLQPNTNQAYRQYYPEGKHFRNASIDYGYTSHRFSFSGETALNDNHALATLNRVSYQPVGNLQLLLLQRFYSHKYYAQHASSFNAGGRIQNENGIFLGLTWKPFSSLSIMAYSDYAHFHGQKYQAAAPSNAWDNLVSVTYSRKKYALTARYQFKIREKDNVNKSLLVNDITQRGRLAFNYNTGNWSLKTQADCTWNRYKQDSFGWMVHETAAWQGLHGKLHVAATIGYFNTNDYQSRIYVYERGPLYQFSFPAYYGEGIHYSLFIRADICRNLMAIGKFSTSNYFDRDHISSGLQQIDHSAMTDMELQVKWRL